MTKKLLLTAIIALLIIAVLFVGCQSYYNPIFSMGDNEADVISNGGLVVKQGDYIYFINGYSDYNKTDARANWFGNVKKGAIMRVRADEDLSKAEIIVPKSIISPYQNSGISIYDDFIYYVSPSTEESKAGVVKTDTIQFMRTRLDGQETRIMYQSSNSSLRYKYTPYGLLYYSQGDIYCKAYDSKHFNMNEEGRLLVEDATAVSFPRNLIYDREAGETIGDYFLYTKASEAMYDNTNKLYIANAEGTVNRLLIDKYTYTDDPLANASLAFKIDVVNTLVEDDGLTVYYTKTEYTGTSSEGRVVGLFVNKIDSTLNFKVEDEVKLSSSTATKIYPLGYEGGAIVFDDTVKVFTPSAQPLIFSGIASVTVIGVVDGYMYYLDGSNKLNRYKLDGSDNVGAIMTDEMHATWIAPEIVGNYMYYFNKTKLNYLYRIDLTTYDRMDEESLVKELVGCMLAKDEESLKDK